jgi:protein-disulfide isomerase
MEAQIPYNPNQPPAPRVHSRGLVVLVIGLAIFGLLLVGALFFVFTILTADRPQVIAPVTTEVAVVASDTNAKSPLRQQLEKLDRPLQGNLRSKLVIVEFADFQCPYCTRVFPIIRETITKYDDDVLYIYRQFPVENENSLMIAQASLCAHDQGKFWQLHDRLYTYHDAVFNDPGSVVPQLAQQAGVNMDEYRSCMSSEKFKSQVLEDADDGVATGVAGTPTFFINGNKIEGVITAAQWDQIIASALEITK